MSQTLRIYLDLLSNIIECLFLIRFSEEQFLKKIPKKNIIFLFSALILYSIPEQVPYSILVCFCMDLVFLLVSFYPQQKKAIIVLIKYKIFGYALITLFFFLHTFIMNDVKTATSSFVYARYKAIICNFLIYITYTIYTNSKKMRNFHSHYYLYFNLIILSVSFILSYTTLYICKTNPDTSMLPLLFTTIALLIILCVSLYDKFLTLLSENAQYKVQVELNRMEQVYSRRIEENLKELHSLRHDIKNHLIIIDGYAEQKNFEKIHSYIERIGETFVSASLFDTTSDTISAILNEKYQIAKGRQIDCQIHFKFSYIHIDDFSITTILGNLLDNAITAATKCKDGWIHIDLYQSDSYLNISIENNHMESIIKKRGEYISTKGEKNLLHGIGLKNVYSTVEALGGTIDISHTSDTFCVHILVPNFE